MPQLPSAAAAFQVCTQSSLTDVEGFTLNMRDGLGVGKMSTLALYKP